MTEIILTLVDVRRIQKYLFVANELRQALGASELVRLANYDWVREALPAKNYVPPSDRSQLDPTRTIESGTVDAELVFAGGGNAAILFRSLELAQQFTRDYTKTLLTQAPGLEAAVAHTGFDWDTPGSLPLAWTRMNEEIMPQRKEGAPTTQPLAGLSVTAECAFTGYPAVKDWPEPSDRDTKILVSAEVLAKLNTVPQANDQIRKTLLADPFEYPTKLEDLGGQHGHASYIAVVHIDGNQMGRRLKKHLEGIQDNRRFVQTLREFSDSLNQAGLAAMQAVRDWMQQSLEQKDGKWYIKDSINGPEVIWLQDEYLPFRPIVFGGDDVTFVSEGRLGLALAAHYLQVFSQQILADENPGYACAGVAIVHAHYPFARGYKLSEALCHSAKKDAREADSETSQVSLINWHLASASLTLEWSEILNHEYTEPAGKLTLRPLVVCHADSVKPSTWRTWAVFLDQLRAFRQDPWKERRNKLKDLKSALRDPQQVKEFTQHYDSLPVVSSLPGKNVESSGWYDGRCLYFDALEMDDLFLYPNGGAA